MGSQAGAWEPAKLQLSPLYTNVGGPSFRQGLPESSPQGCETTGWKLPESNTCSTTSCPPWLLDAFGTSVSRTLRAAKPCKSAVLPICPAIPAGMTDSILPPTLRHPGYSFVYSVFIFNISLNSGYALVPSFKPHVLRYPIRYQVIIRG